MKINSVSTGFIEIPNNASLNIFTQGCSIHCKNCHNKELWDFNGGIERSLDWFLKLLSTRFLTNWICWLGGEPTDQEDLLLFSKEAKKISWKVALYTGKNFKSLDDNLLNYIDLVIDEPFLGTSVKENDTNQGIYIKEQNIFKKLASWNDLVDFFINKDSV